MSGLVYGFHAVRIALFKGQVQELWLDHARHDLRLQEIRHAATTLPSHNVARIKSDQMLPGALHQGVIARCSEPVIIREDDLETLIKTALAPPLFLVLDGIQDPHNLGACLRSADAAGVQAVITPRDRAAGITPVVRKVASGAVDSVPLIQVTNLARTLRMLKSSGVWLAGTTGTAPMSLYQAILTGPLALIMGTEGQGLRRLTAEQCDFLIRIPMQGVVESLNVAVATGICLFEAVRQRQTII